MEPTTASSLATRWSEAPDSPPVLGELKGIVQHVIQTRLPDGAAATVAKDESGAPVLVAVHDGRALRMRATGHSLDDFRLESEVLRLDAPAVSSAVRETALPGDLEGDLFGIREWRYDLGEGRALTFSVNQGFTPPDEALETALAAAAGWP